MDLRQLEILRAVAESGSFTGAGQRLQLSQSAVSRQILLLEAELDEQVFLRIGRRIRITDTGTAVLGLSQRVFKDIGETRARLVESKQHLGGTVNLVGGMTACVYVFPRLVREFRRAHPGVDVRVKPATTPKLIKQLRAGTADLGLLTLPIDDPGLVSEPVMREELMFVASPEHPLAKKKLITPRDLANQPFVHFEPGSHSRQAIEQFFEREHISPKVVSETENVEIIKALVRVRMGVSILPHQAVAREVRTGQLFCSRIEGYQLQRETGWVYPRTGHMPRAVQVLKDMLNVIRPRLRLAPEEAA